MDRSIHLRIAVIGGLLVALVLCLSGAVPTVNLGEYDRFKIEANDSHAFVLDSATGQVWSSAFYISPSIIRVDNDPNFHAIKTFDTDTPFQ